MFTIISAIIAAGGILVSTLLNNAAVEDANQEGLRLANISRNDKLKLEADNKKLSETELRLRKKRLGYEREAELFGRAERAEERGYVRRERFFDKQIGLLNRNDAMRNQLVNVWRKK